MSMAIVNHVASKTDQRAQRALVRRILRVRPDVSPAQLVGILGRRTLAPSGERAAKSS
jgi:hypothetical protein